MGGDSKLTFNTNLSERDAQEAVGIGTRSPAELWAGVEDLNLQPLGGIR